MTFKEILTEYLEVLEIHYKGLKDYGNLLCWVDGAARQSFRTLTETNVPTPSPHFRWWDSRTSLRFWFHKVEGAPDARGTVWALGAIRPHAEKYLEASIELQWFFDNLFYDFESGAAAADFPAAETPAYPVVSVLDSLRTTAWHGRSELQELWSQMEKILESQQAEAVWRAFRGEDSAPQEQDQKWQRLHDSYSRLEAERDDAWRSFYEEGRKNQAMQEELHRLERQIARLQKPPALSSTVQDIALFLGVDKQTILRHVAALRTLHAEREIDFEPKVGPNRALLFTPGERRLVEEHCRLRGRRRKFK